MRLAIVIAASTLALGGCVPYAQRVANTCEQLGMGPGTSDYHDCVMQQVQVDEQNREMWGRTTAVGASMLSPRPTYVVVP